MPESDTLDLTAEDVSQLTWDELVVVMMGKERAVGGNSPRATVVPPCTTDCCTYSAGCSGCSCLSSCFD
jgi:hypothetical protein